MRYRHIPLDVDVVDDRPRKRRDYATPIIVTVVVVAFVAFIACGGILFVIPATIIMGIAKGAMRGARKARERQQERDQEERDAFNPNAPYGH
jgi:hypothetical protein